MAEGKGQMAERRRLMEEGAEGGFLILPSALCPRNPAHGEAREAQWVGPCS